MRPTSSGCRAVNSSTVEDDSSTASASCFASPNNEREVSGPPLSILYRFFLISGVSSTRVSIVSLFFRLAATSLTIFASRSSPSAEAALSTCLPKASARGTQCNTFTLALTNSGQLSNASRISSQRSATKSRSITTGESSGMPVSLPGTTTSVYSPFLGALASIESTFLRLFATSIIVLLSTQYSSVATTTARPLGFQLR
mmetsp:Transcript_20621/g.44555  ORF Transcript_20621/g.44555 Transcript_20621/m.44555 type:complete len:200 (+) Transcript_20621:5856-6455(+)